jgi:rare lipoprotein A
MKRLAGNAAVQGFGPRSIWIVCASAIALSACTSSSGPKVTMVQKARSKEYFSERDYGVKASPRVVNVAMASIPGLKMKRLPRGGGRDQIGKPYKVKGKWYYPKEDPNYRVAGTASWYGDAFHGRLTANGEIYDMNHLSAAHPTMPLPSYARVTNKLNGNSVIVRVNDRGPYASNRVIDLSKRAAQLLDYTSSGTAQVVVEYVGRAPVDGVDDEYLMASFRPGGAGNPDEIRPGVMVAMANASSDGDVLPAATMALAGEEVVSPAPVISAAAQEPFDPFESGSAEALPLPGVVPLPLSRPEICLDAAPCEAGGADVLLSGYADSRVASSHRAAKAFAAMGLDETSPRGWRESQSRERILVGVYDQSAIKGLTTKLARLAVVKTETDPDGAVSVFALPKKGGSVDIVLKNLWLSGFQDAFVVR